MLRSESPDLVRQELAAWAAATEMTRGVARDAALAAMPARKGRRAGQPIQPREIPFTATCRAVIAAIRLGKTGYTALTSALGKLRTVVDRNRHRARKAKCPSTFGHASRADSATRIAGASSPSPTSPPDQRKRPQRPETPQESPIRRPVEPAVARHDTPAFSMSHTGNYPP